MNKLKPPLIHWVIKPVLKAFVLVFSRWQYIALASLTAGLFLLLVIWLPNLSLIDFVLSSNGFTVWNKIKFLYSSLGYLGTNFTWLTRWLTILIAAASGVNITMAIFYLRRRAASDKAAGVGMIGSIIGMLGVGCASCGSVILSSVIGLSASISFIGILPLKGIEFGLAALLILFISINLLAKKILNPLTCKIIN